MGVVRGWGGLWAVWALVLMQGLPVRAADHAAAREDPDLLGLRDTPGGVAVDMDVELTVAAHRLPAREMVASLGQFTACTVAFAARSRVARMTTLLPPLRRALAFQLKDSPLVRQGVELTEKEVGANPTLTEALAAARKLRLGFLMMAVITDAGAEPGVSVRLFHVTTGREVKNRDVAGVLVLESGPDVIRRLTALRPAGASGTRLAVRDAQLPTDLALSMTDHPENARVVGVAVVAEDPGLESMVEPVQRAALEQLTAHKGVRQVEPLAAAAVQGLPNDALGTVAAREELDALVVIRLRRSSEDPQWVETHLLSAHAGAPPRFSLMSRRVVMRTLQSSTDASVQAFRRQAVKADVAAYVTVNKDTNAVMGRRDVPVLVDSKGTLLTRAQVRALPLPEAEKERWNLEPDAKPPEVLPSWPRWVLLAGGPVVGAAVLGVVLGVGLVVGGYGASSGPLMAVVLGLGGFLLGAVLGALAGALAGFMAWVLYGALQGAARAVNWVTSPTPKALTMADAVRATRDVNRVLLQKTGADPVVLDADHFPRDPAAP